MLGVERARASFKTEELTNVSPHPDDVGSSVEKCMRNVEVRSMMSSKRSHRDW